MDTLKRFGINKPKAIMLFVQMILVLFLLAISIYLLVFVISNNLGGWMVSSYIFIILSVLAIIYYGAFGYRRGDSIYKLSIAPFALAVFINILLPNRGTFQVAILAILFALVIAFLIKQEDKKFTFTIGLTMIAASLVFSIYSAITAKIDFLGSISDNWTTYVAMYFSIFIPVIMSVTIVLAYSVRNDLYNNK